jgi:hypothetical protein
MPRILLWLAAAAALCVLGFGVPSRAADDIATAYDQIERVLPPDAAVPGPEAFDADEQETRAAFVPPAANKRGVARFLPSDGRKGSVAQLAALSEELRQAGFPRLERHVFYRGWERIENLATGIVVLRKCDQNALITLDPGRKTYRVEEPLASDRAELLRRASRERPGGASLDVERHVERADARTVAGIEATAYRSAETLRVDAATGSCRPTTIAAQTQTYYAPFSAPVATCPRRAPDFPATPLAVVARDGCRPSVAAHATGTTEPSAPLVLYRLMTLVEGRERLMLLTARGNIRSIVGPGALFEIPPGYARAR